MAGVANAGLCAAVAAAGGIGSVAMGGASTPEVTRRVAAVKALTDRPFSANFIAWLIEDDPSPLDAALEAGVASITLSFGDPAPYVDRVHVAGSLLLNQVQTVEAARRSVEVGVDVIIAQGSDAGGHTGLTPLLNDPSSGSPDLSEHCPDAVPDGWQGLGLEPRILGEPVLVTGRGVGENDLVG